MEHSFWHRRWQKNEIGFHESEPNKLMVRSIDALKLAPNSVVFLPLCGKTLDIGWLLSQGHQVVGIELEVLAVEQLFKQLDRVPEIQVINDDLTCYQGENITIYHGDILTLSKQQLGPEDAIYDRAAMVALPAEMRTKYCRHMLTIRPAINQLLIVFEYDQNQLTGPPFAISKSDIQSYYGQDYGVNLLDQRKAEVRGVGVSELAFLLNTNH